MGCEDSVALLLLHGGLRLFVLVFWEPIIQASLQVCLSQRLRSFLMPSALILRDAFEIVEALAAGALFSTKGVPGILGYIMGLVRSSWLPQPLFQQEITRHDVYKVIYDNVRQYKII